MPERPSHYTSDDLLRRLRDGGDEAAARLLVE